MAIGNILFTFETSRKTRARRRIRLLRNVILSAFAFMAFVAVLAALLPLVLDAAEREQEWRKERLCRIWEVCDPKAGP